jgi:hypothetical protein
MGLSPKVIRLQPRHRTDTFRLFLPRVLMCILVSDGGSCRRGRPEPGRVSCDCPLSCGPAGARAGPSGRQRRSALNRRPRKSSPPLRPLPRRPIARSLKLGIGSRPFGGRSGRGISPDAGNPHFQRRTTGRPRRRRHTPRGLPNRHSFGAAYLRSRGHASASR